MKRSQFAFLFMWVPLLLSSCTHTLYTHQQVLQGAHSKDDVVKQFGQPTEISKGTGLEQWTYNMENGLAKNNKVPRAVPDTVVKDSVQQIKQEKFTKYVKFMFDDNGKVVGYKAKGVDLTENKKDNFGKSLLTITGGILVISAVVALELYNDGAFSN